MVSQLVVHLFEVVKVDEHKGDRTAITSDIGEGRIDHFLKESEIGKASEGIMARLVADLIQETSVVESSSGDASNTLKAIPLAFGSCDNLSLIGTHSHQTQQRCPGDDRNHHPR